MSLLALFVSIGLLAPVQAAQSLTGHHPPGLEVIKFSWDKQVAGWERDPFQRPIESHQDMQRQTATRRPDARRTVDADATIKSHQKEPARVAYRYKVTVKNAGTKTIKALDWDYLFFDATGGQVIGVHQFTSEERIQPGKRKQLIVLTLLPPAQVVNAGKAADKALRSARGQVILSRVEYEDGTTWESK